jgi:hypothetical protein
MAAFLSFVLARGRVGDEIVLDPGALARVEQPLTSAGARAGLEVGYGLGVGVAWRRGIKMMGHTGGIDGYTARYRYMPELGLGYAILSNSTPGNQAFREVDDLVLEFLLGPEPDQPPVTGVLDSGHRRWTGYYEVRNPRIELLHFADLLIAGKTVTVTDDGLYRDGFGDDTQRFVPHGDGLYRRPQDPGAAVAFFETDEGAVMMVDRRGHFERTAAWKPYFHRGLFFGSLALLVTTLLYALYWVPREVYLRLRAKPARVPYLPQRVLPLAAAVSLFGGLFLLTRTPLPQVGQLGLGSLAFFVGSILFAILSFLSLWIAARGLSKPIHPVGRVYGLIVAAAAVSLTSYLGYFGIIGLRLWAY